jgi:hypothetical protein
MSLHPCGCTVAESDGGTNLKTAISVSLPAKVMESSSPKLDGVRGMLRVGMVGSI